MRRLLIIGAGAALAAALTGCKTSGSGTQALSTPDEKKGDRIDVESDTFQPVDRARIDALPRREDLGCVCQRVDAGWQLFAFYVSDGAGFKTALDGGADVEACATRRSEHAEECAP